MNFIRVSADSGCWSAGWLSQLMKVTITAITITAKNDFFMIVRIWG
ncbi:MAG: hypothetical protein J6Z00_04200 [Clostridia bacterium]|nr:hypothetical protein [Clostridia bacterium]